MTMSLTLITSIFKMNTSLPVPQVSSETILKGRVVSCVIFKGSSVAI